MSVQIAFTGAVFFVALLVVCGGDGIGKAVNKTKDLQGLDLAVFWDSHIDNELSKRSVFSTNNWEFLIQKVGTQNIVHLERGCGRPKNMLATLEDGTKVCCRYREHQLKELRGDVYSYYFNTLLNLWNVPPSVLVHVDFSSPQWQQVVNEALHSGWSDKSEVVMTFYVDDLNEVFIPPILRDSDTNLTIEVIDKAALTEKDKIQLAQWSDLIVFDYIIGHTDRLFNTLFNLQWNPVMMQMPVHNLKQTSSGQLVLLDNESGFWMGYSLNEWDPVKYEFQVHFLKHLCVFRRSTIEKIISLASSNDLEQAVDIQLESYIENHDRYSFKTLQKLSTPHRKELISRIKTVVDHVKGCISHQQ